ncbi:nucleolus and neural progenitor protein, partial [Thalassophryne amazonica]|uniref:nucleolus and neural progenitor protein n=1 Tax=Thalassophryne amazonica TaxID=390379 RepID=UPI0014719275
VEQCINRLKDMKLDAALQDLIDLCPEKLQRTLNIQAGEGDVPSQPMLEWLCLKILGAAQLMSCSLSRCSRAFILAKQQMRYEFALLNMVITSMLSRLWVIFRGILASLSSLYQELLLFHKEVAQAQAMPFLKGFSLPEDVSQFLGPSRAFLLTNKGMLGLGTKSRKVKQQKWENSLDQFNNNQITYITEDLGVAVDRGLFLDPDMKPFIKVVRNLTQETRDTEKQRFRKKLTEATTFTDMSTLLEEMILWCKCEDMGKEKRLLQFLHLKCQKLKIQETAGCSVHRKLEIFRQKVCWVFSSSGSVPRTHLRFAGWTSAHRRTCFLRRKFRSTLIRKKLLERRRTRTESSVLGHDQESVATCAAILHTTNNNNNNEIDDIFASLGL